jgi:ATP-dependent Clp protease ATP-binding subunit ClpC
MARLLTSLYPRRWRERYGQEFLQFLQEHPFSIFAVLNVIAGALYQRFRESPHRSTMFSIYTERARRAVFFARYEASQFGSRTIEAEHLLLGAIRESGNVANRLLDVAAMQSISENARAQLTVREKISASVNLPLSWECKRILEYTREEAERLNDRVGVEHLLLGIIREEKSRSAEILKKHGLELSAMRERLARN